MSAQQTDAETVIAILTNKIAETTRELAVSQAVQISLGNQLSEAYATIQSLTEEKATTDGPEDQTETATDPVVADGPEPDPAMPAS